PVGLPGNPGLPPIVAPPNNPPDATPPGGPPILTPPDVPQVGPPNTPPTANPPGIILPTGPRDPPGFPTDPGAGGPSGGPGGGPPTVSSVPEPSLWLQLITGFSLLGAAMRR